MAYNLFEWILNRKPVYKEVNNTDLFGSASNFFWAPQTNVSVNKQYAPSVAPIVQKPKSTPVKSQNYLPTWYWLGAKIESTWNALFSQWQQWGQELANIAQQHAQNVTNRAYRDETKVKKVVETLLNAWYTQDTINATVKKLDAEWKFQWSWTQSPVSWTFGTIESWISKWLGTVMQWVSNLYSAPLQETSTAWVTRLAKWALETWLGSAQTALNVMPVWQWYKALVAPTVNTLFATDTAWKVLEPISRGMETGIWMWQEALWFDPNSSVSRDIQQIGSTAWNLALFAGAQKWWAKAYDYAKPKVIQSISDIRNNISTKNANKAKALTDEWLKEIYEAVNPTTRENKAVLRQRVEDLLPYIDETKRFSNDLETVKGRVDADKNTAFRAMENYETNVWVKWTVNTANVAKELATKYQEKIGKSYINADEARIAQELINTLKWFWKNVKDADIIKIRRAWDKIIEKNKGFMQSAESTSKGDIFADANRFFREEIKRSNPEYAKFLEKAHKTITISDILGATIQRRTGQTQGGFLRKASENTARVVWTGIGTMVWGIPWAFVWAAATEWLLAWVNKLTGSSSKLTKWKKLILNSQKNGTSTINIPNNVTSNMVGKQELVTKWPWLVSPTIKPTTATKESTQPVNLTKAKGGFIRISWGKSEGIKVYKWVNWEWTWKKFPLDYFTTDKKSASQYWKEVIETTIYPKKIADFTNPGNKADLRKILRDNLNPKIADEFIDRAMEWKDSFSYPLYEMVENPKVTQALKDAWYDATKYLDYGNKNSKFARHETIAMLDIKPIKKPPVKNPQR